MAQLSDFSVARLNRLSDDLGDLSTIDHPDVDGRVRDDIGYLRHVIETLTTEVSV